MAPQSSKQAAPAFVRDFEVEFGQHEDRGDVDPVVLKDFGSAGELVGFDPSAYVRAFPEIVRRARRLLASSYVDFKDFGGNDAAYLANLDQVGKEFVPANVRYAGGAPRRRFAVEASYAYGRGEFASSYAAVDEAEAHLMALIEMTENDNQASQQDFDSEEFSEMMALHIVHEVKLEPVSQREIQDLLVALTREAAAEGHSGPAFDKAAEALALLGEELDLPSTPKP